MGFLDSISSSVNRGMAGAERATNTMKLKNQINDINKKRQGFAAQLGASLYDATKDDPAFRSGREPLYDGIAQLDAQREACQAEIARLEAEAAAAQQAARVYICPNCGGRLNDGDMFCAGCGMPAEQVKAANAQPMPQGQIACPNCGAPIGPDDAFCMNCGAHIEIAPVAPVPFAASAAQPEQAAQPVPDAQPRCSNCGAPIAEGDSFCMSCGAPCTGAAAIADVSSEPVYAKAPTYAEPVEVQAVPADDPFVQQEAVQQEAVQPMVVQQEAVQPEAVQPEIVGETEAASASVVEVLEFDDEEMPVPEQMKVVPVSTVPVDPTAPTEVDIP